MGDFVPGKIGPGGVPEFSVVPTPEKMWTKIQDLERRVSRLEQSRPDISEISDRRISGEENTGVT